jgi:sulfate transport system ATP-binding protein
VIHPGDRIGVLIHRLYVLDGDNSIMVENRLKQDPMPVHI